MGLVQWRGDGGSGGGGSSTGAGGTRGDGSRRSTGDRGRERRLDGHMASGWFGDGGGTCQKGQGQWGHEQLLAGPPVVLLLVLIAVRVLVVLLVVGALRMLLERRPRPHRHGCFV